MWFRVKGEHNFRNKRILTPRKIWSTRQNAESRTLPVWGFYSKLRSCNPLETEIKDKVNLLKNERTTEQALVKLKSSKPPPTRVEYYQYLQQIWKQQQMNSVKNFLRWCNITVVVLILVAMQKKITFYHHIISTCWSLVVHYETWPTFFYTNLQIQITIPSWKQIKTCWTKFATTLVVVFLLGLHAKLLLIKLVFKSPQNFGNQLWAVMLASHSPTWRVNPRPPVFIRSDISFHRKEASHPTKQDPYFW